MVLWVAVSSPSCYTTKVRSFPVLRVAVTLIHEITTLHVAPSHSGHKEQACHLPQHKNNKQTQGEGDNHNKAFHSPLLSSPPPMASASSASALLLSSPVSSSSRSLLFKRLSSPSGASPSRCAAPSSIATKALSRRTGVRCSGYAAGREGYSYSSSPIDVVADVKTERMVVLGGTGFVGSAICKAAVSKGIEVVGVGRSGRPPVSDPWTDQVTWVSGDVFYVNWDEILPGATAVVSTLGGFGNEEHMKKINGEANILAVGAAKDYGIPKFVLISVHDYNLPSILLSSGYFTGKRKAESEVLSKYPNSGVVLRPGFIYGKRRVNGFEIPLDLIGEPLEKFLSTTERFTQPLSSFLASDLLFAPPVSVEDVAYAVINAIVDDDFFGVFTIEQIKEAAAKVKV